MTVTTGYGYFVKDGLPRIKYEYPIGEHPDPVGYSFVEVSSKEELKSIKLTLEVL